ncbi:BnaAnng29820D [Brassica napus]|uniref:BnaAnng29820D protein n=1 Tax=Brassica napus TaxID=3708 RepID=A0A078JR28_BRANA|nr:BnaAnng29820D [Brassica napus]
MVSLDLDLRRTFQSVLLSALRTADAAETEKGWRRVRSRPIQASAPNRRYRPDPVVSSPSCAFFFFSGALQKRISLFASGGISHPLLLRFRCRRKLFHLSVCFAPMLRLRR